MLRKNHSDFSNCLPVDWKNIVVNSSNSKHSVSAFSHPMIRVKPSNSGPSVAHFAIANKILACLRKHSRVVVLHGERLLTSSPAIASATMASDCWRSDLGVEAFPQRVLSCHFRGNSLASRGQLLLLTPGKPWNCSRVFQKMLRNLRKEGAGFTFVRASSANVGPKATLQRQKLPTDCPIPKTNEPRFTGKTNRTTHSAANGGRWLAETCQLPGDHEFLVNSWREACRMPQRLPASGGSPGHASVELVTT